jgi:hypothetical protein
VHADIEQLPLAAVVDNAYESVFGKSHFNRPALQGPGGVISHSDAVAAGQRKEGITAGPAHRLLSTAKNKPFTFAIHR